MIKRTFDFLAKLETSQLVMLPVAIGIVIMFIAIGLGNLGQIGKQVGRALVPLGFFVFGFMGLPMIVRKEIAERIPIKGWIVVTEGIILLLGCWGVAILFLGFLFRIRYLF